MRALRGSKSAHPPAPPAPCLEGCDAECRDRERGCGRGLERGAGPETAELTERLGRAFFGESMFHRARDASKIALVHLIARLRAGGYRLLDTQYVTDHLKTFDAVERTTE